MPGDGYFEGDRPWESGSKKEVIRDEEDEEQHEGSSNNYGIRRSGDFTHRELEESIKRG